MQYKTIVLQMIQDRPEMHEYLRSQKILLPVMEQLAFRVMIIHQGWIQKLLREKPGGSKMLIEALATEIALKELEEMLLPASPDSAEEPPSLDSAMAFLRNHTPPA